MQTFWRFLKYILGHLKIHEVNHGKPWWTKEWTILRWGFPKMGVPPQSLIFMGGFSTINHPAIGVYPFMDIPIDTIYPLFEMTEWQVMPWSKPQDVQGHWSGYGALSGANGGKSVWDELSNGHLMTPTMFWKGHVNYTHNIYIYIYMYIYIYTL